MRQDASSAVRGAVPATVAAPPPPAAAARASAAPAPAAPPQDGATRLKREAAAAQAPAGFAADAQADEFTRDLEAIAKLRAEGRNDQADKALEEFRRKHPGYRIPDAMWERVKPR